MPQMTASMARRRSVRSASSAGVSCVADFAGPLLAQPASAAAIRTASVAILRPCMVQPPVIEALGCFEAYPENLAVRPDDDQDLFGSPRRPAASPESHAPSASWPRAGRAVVEVFTRFVGRCLLLGSPRAWVT